MRFGFSFDEVKWVKVPADAPDAVEFSVGYLPRGLFDRIGAESAFALEGQPENAPPSLESWERNRKQIEAYIRWGVKGHKAKDESGKDAPFETESAEYDGLPYKVLTPKTLEMYRRAGLKFLYALAMEVIAFNRLTEAEKKS